MKKICVGIAALLVAGLIGCTGSGTPGGPGASSSTNKPMVGLNEDTFTLDTPALATSLKQGEAKQISIGIKRGKNFKEDVVLKFEGMPPDVSVDPLIPTIKHGDTEAKVTVKAGDKAAVGDFTVKVTGKPTKGPDAINEFKITVKEK
jgi:uncharacterized membrane protein